MSQLKQPQAVLYNIKLQPPSRHTSNITTCTLRRHYTTHVHIHVLLTWWNNGEVFGMLKSEGGLRNSIFWRRNALTFSRLLTTLSPSPSLRDRPGGGNVEGNALEVRAKRKERSKGMIQRGPLSSTLLYIVRNLDLHEHVHVLLINPGVNNK